MRKKLNQGWIADLGWLIWMKIAAVRADKIMDHIHCNNKSLHNWKMGDNEAADKSSEQIEFGGNN